MHLNILAYCQCEVNASVREKRESDDAGEAHKKSQGQGEYARVFPRWARLGLVHFFHVVFHSVLAQMKKKTSWDTSMC